MKLIRTPKHQAQRDDGDCTITCLSMMTGLQWEEIVARTGHDICNPKEGCSDYGSALLRLGFASDDFRVIDGDVYTGFSEEFFNSLFWRRPALLTVESKVIPGGLHSIYYDGTAIYDPAPKARQRFKSVIGLPCHDFVIFRDGL